MNVLILAGGKSKKLNLGRPKWSAELLFKENILYLKQMLKKMGFKDIYICIRKEDVEYLYLLEGLKIIFQYDGISGTAAPLLSYNKINDDTLIIPCSLPLLEIEDVKNFIEFHLFNDNDISVMSSSLNNNDKYGGIMRISDTIYIDEIRKSKLFDIGVYLLKTKYLMEFISTIDKEISFSKLINKANKKYKIADYEVKYTYKLINIETQNDLNKVTICFQRDIIDKLIANKVRILDPRSTHITDDSIIMSGSVINPFTIIQNSIIGENTEIGPFSLIKNSMVGSNRKIKSYTEIENSILPNE